MYKEMNIKKKMNCVQFNIDNISESDTCESFFLTSSLSLLTFLTSS